MVSDYKLIKELFNEASAIGRPTENAVAMEFTKGPYGIFFHLCTYIYVIHSMYVYKFTLTFCIGVINSTGSTWEANRKFNVKTLRNLGFANGSMETMKLDEVKVMLDWFRKQEGSPVSGVRIFNAPVINSLWRIVTGERFNWEDSRPDIMTAMDTFIKYN